MPWKFTVLDVKALREAIPPAVLESGEANLEAIAYCIEKGIRYMPGVNIFWVEDESYDR